GPPRFISTTPTRSPSCETSGSDEKYSPVTSLSSYVYFLRNWRGVIPGEPLREVGGYTSFFRKHSRQFLEIVELSSNSRHRPARRPRTRPTSRVAGRTTGLELPSCRGRASSRSATAHVVAGSSGCSLCVPAFRSQSACRDRRGG